VAFSRSIWILAWPTIGCQRTGCDEDEKQVIDTDRPERVFIDVGGGVHAHLAEMGYGERRTRADTRPMHCKRAVR
jgi:hypothetical protein